MDTRRRLLLQAAAALGAGSHWPLALAQGAPQGVTDTEVLVGSHQDLSGPVASLGSPLRDGMQLAVDDLNAAGGVHGRRLRLLVEDTGFDPKRAVLATEKLVRQDKIFALIGSLGSATVQASMPVALEAGVPVLFSGTPADFNYTPFHKLKFAGSITYSDQVRALVKHAVEKLGKKRIGVLYQDDETGLNVLRATEDQLKVQNLPLIEKTSYKRGAIDFSSQIARLKAADVDLVILGTIIRETAGARMEAKKLGWNVDMMVTNAGMNDAVIKIGGAAMEGLYASAQFVSIEAQPVTPEFTALLKRYRDKFGKEPLDGALYGYWAMSLFGEGLKNAGRALTVDSLVAGLERVKNFRPPYLAVPASFGPGERLASRNGILTQVKDGKFMPLSSGTISY